MESAGNHLVSLLWRDRRPTAFAFVVAVALLSLAWWAFGALHSQEAVDPGDRDPPTAAALPRLRSSATPTVESPEPVQSPVRAGGGSGSGTISGSVVDEWGNAVSGGDVVAQDTAGTVDWITAPVDERGRFEVRLPAGEGDWQVRYVDRERCLAALPRLIDGPVEQEEFELTAFRCALARVRVLGPTREVVRNAQLRVGPGTLSGRTEWQDVGPESLTVPVLCTGVSVTARTADGYQGKSKIRWFQPGEVAELDVVCDQSIERRLVRLTAGGAALRHVQKRARIRVAGDPGREWREANVDGPAVELVRETNTFDVALEISDILGGRHVSVRRLPQKPSPDGVDRLVVEDVGMGSVRVQCRSLDGEAVAGARLELRRGDATTQIETLSASNVRLRAITGADGRAAWNDLPLGDYEVVHRSGAEGGGELVGRLTLRADAVETSVQLENCYRLWGTYAGPGRVGRSRVTLRIDGPLGTGVRVFAPVREGLWSVAVPLPIGAAVRAQPVVGLRPLGASVEGRVGEPLDVRAPPVADARIRVAWGDRKRVVGFVRLRAAADETVEIGYVDPNSGYAEFRGGIRPGAYEAGLFADTEDSRLLSGWVRVVVEENGAELVIAFP